MDQMDITPIAVKNKKNRKPLCAEPGTQGTPASRGMTPNNDRDERRDTRRHSAAKLIRKSLGGGMPDALPAGAGAKRQGMHAHELGSLYDRVIKLGAENKITKDNTWHLDIICHMPDIVRDYSMVGQEFTFQKASCGLDAGVTIYSKRVDSVYDTCKETLFGFMGVRHKSGLDDPDDDVRDDEQDNDQEEGEEGSQGQDGKAKATKRKNTSGYADPNSTLAAPESLKAKASEMTFDADPLFGKTSKLFDESSAAGLLMLNLAVYANCEIMFDSAQVPSSQFPVRPATEEDMTVDLGLVPGLQQLLAASAQPCFTITPSIQHLHKQLGPQASWEQGGLTDPAMILQAALDDEARSGMVYAAPGHRAHARSAAMPAAGPAPGMDDNVEEDAGGMAEDMDMGDAMDCADAGYPAGFDDVDGGSPRAQQEVSDDGFLEAAADDDTMPGLSGGVQQQGPKDQEASFQVDEDGFVTGPGMDDEHVEAFGGAGLDAAISDGEGDGSGEGDPGVASELNQWLSSQQRSLAARLPAVNGARSKAWAGPGFWKFSKAARGSAVEVPGSKEPAKRTKSKQAGALPQLDSGDEDPNLAERMSQKAKPAETQLRKRSRVKTLLPVDLHIEQQRLFRIWRTAYSDHDVLSIWRSHAAAAMARHSDKRSPTAAAGRAGEDDDSGYGEDAGYGSFGDGGDDGYEGNGEGTEFAEEERTRAAAGQALLQAAADAAAAAGMLGPGGLRLAPLLDGDQQDGLPLLLPAPRKVQRLDVSYDKVAKVVDVRHLKAVILDSIKHQVGLDEHDEMSDDAAGRAAAGAQLPFQQIISGLQSGGSTGMDERHNSKGSQEEQAPLDASDSHASASNNAPPFKDLSVHLCFICLLHLANDHGLQLTNHGQLNKLSISKAGAV